MHPKFHIHRTLKSSSFLITEIIAHQILYLEFEQQNDFPDHLIIFLITD